MNKKIYFFKGLLLFLAISAVGTAQSFADEEKTELSIYSDILRNRDTYAQYYAVTENIPSDHEVYSKDGTEKYYYAISDIDGDGAKELLLGYDLHIGGAPGVLLNILRYDKEQELMIDVDGERTYPLMDNLTFYASGYYSTQNGAGGLYTECWYLYDKIDHYWYGYERCGDDEECMYAFLDTDGLKLKLIDYYHMIGENTITLQWYEATEKNIALMNLTH